MPVLAAECSLNPPELLSGMAVSASDRRWSAMYTKPRQEKAFARQLVAMDLSFYLPLIPKTSVVRGKRTKSYIPLFGGYVFFLGTDEERIRALGTNRVTMTIPAPSVEEMTNDLRNVQTLIESGVPLTVEGNLRPGRRVRVISGALMGVEGVITERRGQDHLLVSVEFLQQGVSVLIQDFLVEPV